MTKQDVIEALGNRPSSDELRKMDDTRINPLADGEITAADWLNLAFLWADSPQGHDYWNEEHEFLCSQNPKL